MSATEGRFQRQSSNTGSILGATSARRQRWLWKGLFVLLPSCVLVKLHLGMNDMDFGGLLTDQIDLFDSELLNLPSSHAAFGTGRNGNRHLSSHLTDLYSGHPSQAQQKIITETDNNKPQINSPANTAYSEDEEDLPPHLRATAAPTKRESVASVPLSLRREQPKPAKTDSQEDTPPVNDNSNNIDNTESGEADNNDDRSTDDDNGDNDGDDSEDDEDNEKDKKEKAKRIEMRKKRLEQARKRRKREKQEDEGWLKHPEGETDFSYVPLGKYASRDLAARNTTSAHNATNPSPYAYAFVMGGVNEQDGRYLGMFYNILIAAYILDKEGSAADIVVYVQMSSNSTLTELPPDNVRLLDAVNVKIKYLPKPKVENFHQIIMQKLVVLEAVEYKRVLFLDTDVMPFCNLDYVFQLSDGPNPILKKNLIIALSGSPANAGFWMVSPKPGELEKIQGIVAKQQEGAKKLPPPHFDYRKGWGHVIQPPDEWWTINKLHTRRAWKFVGSHADQGLLYHWVKYVKRSVSIVSGVDVDNYGPKNTRERVRLEETLKNPFDAYTCLPEQFENSFGELPTPDAAGMAPYRDFVHFLGSKKPWKHRLPPPVPTNIESATPEQYWFFMLRLLNKELNMGIDFANWQKIKQTPLGSLPKKEFMAELLHSNQTLLQLQA